MKRLIKNKIILIALSLLISIIIISGCVYQQPPIQSICGNGIVEKGETMQTCCEDTSCLGEQTCQNHQCIEPACGECEYLKNHQCLKYRCCSDVDCIGDQTCVNHECKEPTCGECQYLDQENHKCVDYVCCKDIDCDDSNDITDDVCLNPKTKAATCQSIQKTCSDGTEIGECSLDKPKYCNARALLIDNCGECGCPDDLTCAQDKESCTKIACTEEVGCFRSKEVNGIIQVEVGVCRNPGTPEAHCEY